MKLENGYIQQTQNICITFVQRRPNVFDVGPTLYKCYTNVLRFLGRRDYNFSGFIRYILCPRLAV